jgi:hypothetical protein
LSGYWCIVFDIYYDKPWGASSDVAQNIRNEYQYGEGERANNMRREHEKRECTCDDKRYLT